jgi:hypothetical protein
MTLMLWFGLWRRGTALVEAIGAIRCVSVCFLRSQLRRIGVGDGGVSRGETAAEQDVGLRKGEVVPHKVKVVH